MSQAVAKFSEVKEHLLKVEEFKAKYEKLKPRYDVISQLIESQTIQNINQDELGFELGLRNRISAAWKVEHTIYPGIFSLRLPDLLGKKSKLH